MLADAKPPSAPHPTTFRIPLGWQDEKGLYFWDSFNLFIPKA
jgi:hypothetical protein